MIKKIYLAHHTHFDIGYTDQPEDVVQQQMRHLDRALLLARQDSRFRWTIESGRLLDEYARRRSPEALQELVGLLRTGRFEVEALNMQMLTETASSAEFIKNVSLTVDYARKYGYSVDTAMLDDIGGYAAYLPSVLAQHGVKYFVAGVGSCQAYLPWAKLPHLFYHKSPDGRKVLVWNLGIDRTLPPEEADNQAVYSQGVVFLTIPSLLNSNGTPESIVKDSVSVWTRLTRRLEREQYPYEEILLQNGRDNEGPDSELLRIIDILNASGQFPEIELTTPREFFKVMESKHGDEIPECSGVITDAWDLRANHIPTCTKNNRQAQSMYQSSLLWGSKDCSELLEDMMLVADHTFGLMNWHWQDRLEKASINGEGMRDSIFDPFRKSWEAKDRYGQNAIRKAEYLWDGICGQRTSLGEGAFMVRNSAPHDVSGYVECYVGARWSELKQLRLPDGSPVPFQKTGDRSYAFWAENVPAGGAISLQAEFQPESIPMPVPENTQIPSELSAGQFKIAFDITGLIRSIRLGDIECADGLVGEVLAEDILNCPHDNKNAGMTPLTDRRAWHEEQVSAKLAEDGPLFSLILRRGRICRAIFEERITIWKADGKIDISLRLNKPECTEKESYYLSFPIKHAKGRGIFFDQNIGVVNACQDLLPGSCQELFWCSRYAAVEGGAFTGILSVSDAPIVCIGGMNLAKWERELPFNPGNGRIHSLIYNNLCNTDAPCWKPILDTFKYSLKLVPGNFSPVTAQEASEASTALSCVFGSPSTFQAITGFPKELRLHAIGKGDFWVENLTDRKIDYDFTLLGITHKGRALPLELKRL